MKSKEKRDKSNQGRVPKIEQCIYLLNNYIDDTSTKSVRK